MEGPNVMLMHIQNWSSYGWKVKFHDCYKVLHVFNAQVNSSGAMQAIFRFEHVNQDTGYRVASL